jgi:hypothetical protein
MATELTGGYDICIELDRTVLTTAVAPTIMGIEALRRIELPIAGGTGPAAFAGALTLFVTSAGVEVAASEAPALKLLLRFDAAALHLVTPVDNLPELAGTLSLTVPVSLGNPLTAAGGLRTQNLIVALSQARDPSLSLNARSTPRVRELATRSLCADDARQPDRATHGREWLRI